MKLKSIELVNFKGIKQKRIQPDGNNIIIRGANGAGKTTIFDAWLWLLFGKDSTGRSSFEVKTLDSIGNAIHGLDHIVEAVVEHEGMEIMLRKEFKEKWTKKRGDSDSQLSGHETTCFIDGVPVKTGEYAVRIGELLNEELFKLLSDPNQFQRLDWKKRRELMMSLIKSSDDRLLDEPQFDSIRSLVEKHGTEDAMLLLKDRRRKFNDQIKQIPVRIDEASRNASELPQNDAMESVEQTLAELVERRASFEQEAKARAKRRIDEQAKVMEQIQFHKNQLRGNEQRLADATNERKRTKSDLDGVLLGINNQKAYLDGFDNYQKQIRNQFAEFEAERTELRRQYIARKAEQLDLNTVDSNCPTCGQSIQNEMLSDIFDGAKAKFDALKARDLDDITKRGAMIKSRIDALNTELESSDQKLDSARQAIIQLNVQKAELEKALSLSLPDYSTQFEQTNDLIAALNEKLQAKFELFSPDTTSLDAEIADAQRMIAQRDGIETSKARVTELEAEGKRLTVELVSVEGQIVALEGYIKTKVERIEEDLNSLFKSVKFKLFEQQLNGGLNETFVTLIAGVPFADANTASQINAGLEIIEHLSNHYGVRTSVFVDHRESVSRLVPINSQIINLLVDENHKELKVEMEA